MARGLRRTADRTEAQRHLDSLRRPFLGQPQAHELQTLNKEKYTNGTFSSTTQGESQRFRLCTL
jgi:hypothetical protein